MRSLLALPIVALAFAGCGSDGGTPAKSNTKDTRQAFVDFSRCMSQHGAKVATVAGATDPGGGGQAVLVNRGPDGKATQMTGDPATINRANAACRHFLDNVKPPELSDAQQKTFRDAALKQAQCMREHGIDMPDPTFDGTGRATVHVEKGSGVPAPGSAPFTRAEQACRKYMPKLAQTTGGQQP